MEGQRLSHYEIQEKLGGGGMGVVYKALDTRLNRHVALKFLPPEFTRDDDARLRFTQEAQAASALDHPNICTIYEIDSTVDGQMFIAMSYYAGSTLKQRVAEGPLDVAEALDVAAQIARGLIKAPRRWHRTSGHQVRERHANTRWARENCRLRYCQVTWGHRPDPERVHTRNCFIYGT